MADFSFVTKHRLIFVPVRLHGPKGIVVVNFVLDTGASHTIVDYRLVEGTLGYSRMDAISKSRVSSAAGKEEGYRIKMTAIESLGKKMEYFEVACHALYEQGVMGLLGMTFLGNFEFCIFPPQNIIRIK